jgi:hypothetical protein
MVPQDKVALVYEHTRPLRPIPPIQIPERRNESLDCHTTRPQHAQRAVLSKPINNGTLEADGARATIEEKRETASTAEIS